MFVKISVQKQDFSLQQELDELLQKCKNTGAIVTFTGIVREDNRGIVALELEHYPGMSEKQMKAHVEQAAQKWKLEGVTVIHRTGYLTLASQIVGILVCAKHRREAFSAAEFIMDYLKSEAPFWKKEHSDSSSNWVEKNAKDEESVKRWEL